MLYSTKIRQGDLIIFDAGVIGFTASKGVVATLLHYDGLRRIRVVGVDR